MSDKITVRREIAADFDAIRAVTVEAFSQSEFGHNGEADLVALLSKADQACISLVAVCSDEIVGHILFSPTKLQTSEHAINGMGLGPMCVRPALQSKGIGSKLIQSGLAELSKTSSPFVVVLGHPLYYQKFGFQVASNFDIRHGFNGIPQDPFLILPCGAAELPSGEIRYREEFGEQFSGSS